MADDVDIKIGADVSGLVKGVEQAKTSVESLAGGLGEAGAALAAAFSLEAVDHFIERMAQLGEQTERMAAILGMSTREVGQFSLIAKETGGSAEQMAFGLERFASNLQRAQAGIGPSADALKAMNIQAKDLIGLPIVDVVGKIADKFAQWSDGTNKTALAIALFGRSGANMIPILDQGSAGLNAMRKEADDLGISLDEVTTKRLAELDHALVKARAAATGFGAAIVSYMAPAIEAALNWLGQLIGKLNEFFRLVTGMGPGIAEATTGGEKGAAPGMAIPNKDAIKEATLALEMMIDAVRSHFDRMKTLYAGDAALHKITEAQKVQFTIEALNGAESRIREYYQKEMSIAGMTAGQIMEVRRRMNKELDRLDMERLKLEQEAALKTQEYWFNAGSTILTAWNGHLRGLLAGTESFKSAMLQTFGDLIIKMIELVEEVIMRMLVLLAIEQLAGVGGFLGGVGGSSIFGQALKGALKLDTGAWEIGKSGAFPSYASGGWEIPGAQMALLHAGEMVIPQGPAQAIRDGLGGGGNTVNFQVSAIDGASVQSFFREHGSKIAAIVSDKITRNSSLRPAY